MKKCGNCKHRAFRLMYGIEYCIWYEMTTTEEDEVREASKCTSYKEGTPSCFEDDYYCPSSTSGDYSPSNPWDAPGMSIKDFI